MKYFILTGASKGLGEGIALALIDPGHHIICIARTANQTLQKLAKARDCRLDFVSFDLFHTQDIPSLMGKVFDQIDQKQASGIFLINNAGVIHPVARVEDCPADQTERHMRINLLAPMLLCAAFIEKTLKVQAMKRILNISSGAAQNPYYGWSNYCTGKAGLDMFGRCIAEEQRDEQWPVQTMAVAPGIIDTEMQTAIRNTDDRAFIHRKKFIELKETGKLISPAIAGKALVKLLLSDDFKDGEVTDIRDSY